MTEIGYKLSSEEHNPKDLVTYARRAEDAGFTFSLISDHFHPWTDRQGHSPFVWTVIVGVAEATDTLRLGTGVTSPTIRIHPAIIAQAAATSAAMMPGRFFLGVGSGENLNEHILGDRWPPADLRLEMLEEAVDVLRLLWKGGKQTHYGRHYTVENARIYTLPDEPPPVYVAAGGQRAAEVAGRIGDGYIGTAPQPEMIKAFEDAGGRGKPRYCEAPACWNEREDEARRIAYEWWPNAAIKGELSQELPMPAHFEQAAQMVTQEQAVESVPCGPDPERHIEAVSKFIDAGYDHVCVHQIGPDQEGFIDFYEREVLPKIR